MLSPFPGMDPFLEDKAKWNSVHARLIVAISDQLAVVVALDFYVDIEQRVYITALDQDDLEIKDRFIEIRDAENREVVTTIELLSPFNKTSGTEGYSAFQSKCETVMAAAVHWIEIDLLRGGERPLEVANQSDYYALLKRGHTPGPYEVWYFDLRDRMPTVAVPLRPPYADVPLNLQAAFEHIYSRARYAYSLDYTRPIPPPHLRPADADWVESCIGAWFEQRLSAH